MSTSTHSHRVAALGISGGIALALPALAAVALMPIDEGFSAASVAVPVAGGALLGVGLHAATQAWLDSRVRSVNDCPSSEREPVVQQRDAGITSRLRSHADQGVPVISRAVDALDEEAAWAEIDAMFSDGSPISCDPSSSKDMYQIAIEELRRSERAAQDRAKEQEASQTAQLAALASLYGPSSTSSSAGIGPQPEASEVEEVEVPMADYSGHEDMWAAAVAILEEDSDSAPMVAPIPVDAPQQGTRASSSSSHDYLRVIQGGTAQFMALRAEA